MKKLLKVLFLTIVISIFLFSNNKIISTARNFCAEKGSALYHKGTNVLSGSSVKFLASTGNFIK